MRAFFEGLGAILVGLFILLVGFFVVVGFYSVLLLLVYYIGYFSSYIIALFIPQIKSIQYGAFDYHNIIGFIVALSLMFSTNWFDKVQFTFGQKK